MSAFATFYDVPEVKTKLGRHRLMSPLSGLHVSPLALGAMSIGDQWGKFGFGSMTKESSLKLLDAFYDAGGNFIDTAGNYQDETSEMFIGEWAEQRGIRDQLVIATKYTSNYKRGQKDIKQQTVYSGNHNKSLHLCLDASLKKLRTTYVDILYVHWWDFMTPVEEVMNSLHNVVAQGKVLFLGISDAPAWVVSQANQYARDHGKTPFVIYQGAWNVMDRSMEREIIPMCKSLGLAIAPWKVLGGGKFRTDEEEEERARTGEKGRELLSSWKRTETERKMSLALEEVGKEVGTKSVTAVATAYVMQKTPYVFPLIGGRKVEHLMSNLEALNISLTSEHIKYLESIIPFDPGFPASQIGDGTTYHHLYKTAGTFDRVSQVEAIRPTSEQ